MYQRILGIFIILSALLLGACPMDDAGSEDENQRNEADIAFEGGKGEMQLRAIDGEPRFFSLATGREITAREEIESKAWDIAFFATRIIWTNSGKTAADYFSGGNGGVWHTNQTDFDAVTDKDDAITDDPVYTPYNQDVLRYAHSMNAASLRFERNMNVMTFVGYENDGVPSAGKSADNPFSAYYRYNKKAFYSNLYETPYGPTTPMPPNFYVTNQVYIIRHGDGEHYSKFQVTEFVRNYDNGFFQLGSDTYGVRWENLP